MSTQVSLVERVGNIARTASITTAATTAAVTTLAKLETGHAPAALNAVSHILWGDRAAKSDALDAKHTALGGALNATAMGVWAVAHELLPRAKSLGGACAKGALLSAGAYVVDYQLVPKRLTPGFERRLSRTALFITYGVLAAAFAYCERLAQRRER